MRPSSTSKLIYFLYVYLFGLGQWTVACNNNKFFMLNEIISFVVSFMEEKPRVDRPLGVAVLAVLDIIGGILAFIGGITMAAVSAMVNNPDIRDMIRDQMISAGVANVDAILDMLVTVLIVVGVIMFIMGLVGVVVGWGFWAGKQWAWIIGVIFYVVGVVISVVGMVWPVWSPTSVIGIIIGAVILYYLFRPNVKAWFGRT